MMETIAVLHEENTKWLRELDFYADELRIMQEHIAEIAAKNTTKLILPEIEHFQNQLVLQKENIDEIRHAVKDHENYLEHRVDENPVQSVSRKVHDHPRLRERLTAFERVFNELRHELNSFLVRIL